MPETLPVLFGRVAGARPCAPAVADRTTTLSYAELDTASDELAARLVAHGVAPGDLIGLQVSRTVAVPVAILGILKAGAAYVPLDPAYPDERLRMMVSDAGIRTLVGDPGRAAGYGLDPGQVIEPFGTAPATTPPVPVRPDDPAYVVYTSGSTGRPKGCVVTHRNVTSLLEAALPLFDVDDNDRWSLFHSISFDFSVWELWGALATGATCVLVAEAEAVSGDALVSFLVRERITVLSQVPSVFRSLSLAHEQAGAPPLELRYVVFGGESVDLDVIGRFAARVPAPRLINMYGITEITVHATFKQLTPGDLAGPVRSPVGSALPHLAIELRDETGAPVAPGQPGEMWISGAGVAAGYLHRSELTAERFVTADGRRYYRSGDLARRLPSGEFEYLGRTDQQVKLRGFRIEPGEIEAILRDHRGVRDAAVTVVSTAGGAQFLTACVVPAADELPDLRTYAAGALPGHMVPHRYLAVSALPRTPSGKLDRAALTDLATARPSRGNP